MEKGGLESVESSIVGYLKAAETDRHELCIPVGSETPHLTFLRKL
jgi:hypothetical protein